VLSWPMNLPPQVGLYHQSAPAEIAAVGSTKVPHLVSAVLEPHTTPSTFKEAPCQLQIKTLALIDKHTTIKIRLSRGPPELWLQRGAFLDRGL
jgi:hypothetical protein